MRKKFLAMYALAGALVASPVFTSCVDDSVSDSVEALRGAKVEALKAQAAYDNALAQAALINANANAALSAAQAEYQKAQAAYREAEAKAQELQNQITEGTLEADLAAALAEAEAAKLEAEQALAIAKINAEKALEMAKWQAQQEFWYAEQMHAQQQANYEKFIAGLANEDKRQAENINTNVNAILKGGTYYGWNTYGSWSYIRNYAATYNAANSYTSINGLIAGLATEKVNLIKLQNGLVDLAEYIAGEKEKNDETIATNKALIEKYTALMESSSRESLEKEYKVAEEAQAEISALLKENAVALYKARLAKSDQALVMGENLIQEFINDEDLKEYFTAKEAEKYEATYKNAQGETTEYEGTYAAVYEHSAEDATQLADDIAEIETAIAEKEDAIEAKEAEIADKEAEIAQVNVTDKQRQLAIMEAEFAPEKEAYEKVLASEGLKKYMAELEKAVADAQAAFDKTPTTPLKQALEKAEEALETADYEYEEGKLLSQYTAEIEGKQADIDALKDEIDEAIGDLEEDLADLEKDLNALKDNEDDESTDDVDESGLKQLNEELEAVKVFQAMLAADSQEMKAYLALCEERAALEKAWFDLDLENTELTAQSGYYSSLMTALKPYIEKVAGKESQLLPDYAALIEGCESEIKKAERANESLVYGDNNDKLTDVVGENEAAQEKLIADKKAEIAAMEAELETRQAEYKAEVAALNALLGTAEEE